MFRRILIPAKFNDPPARLAATFAAGYKLASEYGAKLTVATIIPGWITVREADYSWDARKRFQTRACLGLEALKAKAGDVNCDTIIRWGRVPGSIVEIAESRSADLIILPRTINGFFDFIRNHAYLRVASLAPCPVLFVVDGGPNATPAALHSAAFSRTS